MYRKYFDKRFNINDEMLKLSQIQFDLLNTIAEPVISICKICSLHSYRKFEYFNLIVLY